ncbi:MAG: hypothetical protein CYG60_18990 [Actinobacteria bacterium]|nr:MAG: hypothetical protein CYG60_18990 [Actinomycetota bacterium]
MRLVDLTGSGLARIGATSEIFSGDYAQEWSRALHGHPKKPDGLRYRLKHDPDRIGVAIFGRAEGLIRSRAAGTLLGAGRRKLLAAILNEYRFGLVGGP